MLFNCIDSWQSVSSSIGFGTPFGKLPSGLLKIFIIFMGSFGSSVSSESPAQPLPAFTTTFNELIF